MARLHYKVSARGYKTLVTLPEMRAREPDLRLARTKAGPSSSSLVADSRCTLAK
jgi:hypothetical protein